MSVEVPTISKSFPSTDPNKTTPNTASEQNSPTTTTQAAALITTSAEGLLSANTTHNQQIESTEHQPHENFMKKKEQAYDNLESLRRSSTLSIVIAHQDNITTSQPPPPLLPVPIPTVAVASIRESLPPLRETFDSLPSPSQLTSISSADNNNMMSYQRIQPPHHHSHQSGYGMNSHHHHAPDHGHMYSLSPPHGQQYDHHTMANNSSMSFDHRQPAQFFEKSSSVLTGSSNRLDRQQQQHVNNEYHYHHEYNNYDVHPSAQQQVFNHHMHSTRNHALNNNHMYNSSPTSPTLPTPVPTSNLTSPSNSFSQPQQHVVASQSLHGNSSPSERPQSSTFNVPSSTPSGKSSPVSSNNEATSSNAKRTNGHQAHITMTTIKFNELAVYFDWKLEQACEAIGISSTSMKKLCRHFNIPRLVLISNNDNN